MQWMNPTRRGFNQGALVAALQSLDRVCTNEEFTTWTQTDFLRALPHHAFVACVGKVRDQHVAPIIVLSANFPEECLGSSATLSGSCASFLLQSWLQSGQHQLFDPRQDGQAHRPGCLNALHTRGVDHTVAHGLFDVNREHVAFFSFHQLPHPPRSEQATLLRLTTPAMQAALLRCMRSESTETSKPLPTPPALTTRETEVLNWIAKGKTNSEIASILHVSPHTVKNQTQAILVKLKVNTRAQAAVQAMRLRLVS
jgi:DNA-binding CsgD family transcriptional regulator